MSRGDACPEPPRLAAENSLAGALLRRADEAFQSGLAEGSAWQRFQSRNSRRYWAFALVAAAAFGAAVLCSVRVQRRLAVDAEPARVTAERIVPRPSHTPESSAAPASLGSLGSSTTGWRDPPLALPVVAPHASKLTGRPEVEVLDDAGCRALASDGKVERAISCFRALGRGAGLNAEVALYEAARLSGERLNDSRRALALLDEHRERFPASALRGEVDWLRARSLERAGKVDEALAASEQLLATPAGASIASKLHLLRGRIYSGPKADCAQAVSEYVALLGEPGPDGDQAELQRALCLERLFRTTEAHAAYERYLERPNPASAALAKVRLSALGAAFPLEPEP